MKHYERSVLSVIKINSLALNLLKTKRNLPYLRV